MNWSRFLSALAAFALSAAPVSADLTKIDRAIRKEPAYQASPKYCLLVLGPEAKTRVWLVQDGDVLYVDRNGDGNLTEKGEAIKGREEREDLPPAKNAATGKEPGKVSLRRITFEVGDITELDGTARHTHVRLSMQHDKADYLSARINGKVVQYVQLFQLADRPQDAPILHFNGPLAMRLYGTGSLAGGKKDMEVYAVIGTPGVGKTLLGQVCTSTDWTAVPEGLHPVAEIEFPSKQPGGEPIRAKVTLSKRC
jgi:hypothetical protein